MDFDDYVPTDRRQVRGPFSWLLWAFFGNDDDGMYGPPGSEPTDSGFWSWWFRNRAHNLCFQVLRRRVIDPVYVLGHAENDPYGSLILRFRPFFLKLGPAFFGWRADKPHPFAWGGKYGYGGGAFDIGFKRLG